MIVPSSSPSEENLARWSATLQTAWARRERSIPEALAMAGEVELELADYASVALESLPLAALAVMIWNIQAVGAWRTGKPVEAVELSVRASRVAREAGLWIDCARACLNHAIGLAYQGEYSQAIAQAEQARDLFEKNNDVLGLASALSAVGNMYRVQSNYARAETSLKEALRIQKTLGNVAGIIIALNNLGTVYLALQEDSKGIDCLTECIELCRQQDNPNIRYALNNMGTILDRLGKYGDAIRFYQESYEIKKSINDLHGQAVGLNNIGICQKGLGHYEAALASHNQALKLFLQIKDRWGEANCQEALGELAGKRGDFKEARRMIEEALAIRVAMEEWALVRRTHINLASHVLNLPDEVEFIHDSGYAIDHLRQALATLDGNMEKTTQLELHTVWHGIYKRLGQYEEALQECELVLGLEREVQKEKSTQKLQHITLLHELENESRKAEIQQLRTIELAALLAEADKQREIAQRANRFKSDLLAIAAHDLRNPLSNIMGFAELMLTHLPPSENEGRQLGQKINADAWKMLTLINELLDSSEIDSESFALELDSIDLSITLVDMVQAHWAVYSAKDQHCETTVSGRCVVLADYSRFKQLLDNLIIHAIKHTAAGQRFWVRASPLSKAGRPEVLIEVGYPGHGLTAEELPLLFKQFKRHGSDPSDRAYSTDLGLSIVKRLVEAHEGRIWATSDGLGKGTRFYFALPAVQA